MTYNQLIEAVQTWLDVDEVEFVKQIPTFIRQAEERIYRMADIAGAYATDTSQSTVDGTYTFSTPSDFLYPLHFAVVSSGDHVLLDLKEESFIRSVYPDPTVKGVPKYYAVRDRNTFVLGPTPNVAMSTEIHYYRFPTSITTAGTSFLGDEAEVALLYGTLIEAYTFLKGDPDIMQLYIDRFNEGLALLKNEVDGKAKKDAYRYDVVRVASQ